MFQNLFISLSFAPMMAALAVLVLPGKSTRYFLAAGTGMTLIASALLLINEAPVSTTPAFFSSVKFTTLIQCADFALLGLILYIGIKSKNRVISGLSLAQIILLSVFEGIILNGSHAAPAGLFCDNLALIMVLIISIAGALIVFYALPYMEHHEQHLNLKKTAQPRFFALLFFFIGAMNALVLVNDLMLFYFCFELTTLCSFLLIGHDQTKTARANALTALLINSFGGLALLLGIVLIYIQVHTLDIQTVISTLQGAKVMLIPLGLLCIAGFTKAAQMPFQKWLLGAMVAPTPASALLHSSTMVKAGVYLVIRFAPAFEGTMLSTCVGLCGAFTFVSAAALAIGQSNGKKVLAYSTISNLGLILACAGVNTHAAITAAILLIIFHAVSKALLFLCVGSIEQHIGSRDIEHMRGLFATMPKTAAIITLAILTMILPPFGMLLGKWMAIESAAGNLFLLLMLALGSALTVVYWARWAGILIGADHVGPIAGETMPFAVKLPLYTLLGSAVILSLSAPCIYGRLILADQHLGPAAFSTSFGVLSNAAGSFAVIPLFLVAVAVFIFALKTSGADANNQVCPPYMSGISGRDAGTYVGPMNHITQIVQSNYYLSAFFGEKRLSRLVNATACILILIMIGASV